MLITIRPFRQSDYPAVEKNLKDEQMYVDTWDSQDNLASMIERDPESVLIAEVDGNVVGQIIIVTHGRRIAYLFRLAVDKQYRGKGVGSKLLTYAEELLKKKGFLEVAFFVNDQKDELKEYYKKRNYQTSGRKYITMWKPLQ